MRLKVIFAGTPEFAIPSLHALVQQHDVCAVYTKPDSPSGRGLKLHPSAVKQEVMANYPHLPILQPTNLKDDDTQRQLASFGADVMVVIAYGLILPKAILSLFEYGCINIHASLLPRWRGAAPIQRTLLAGDDYTGVTIMQIDEGLDTGDMLLKQTYKITPEDTTQTVHDQLSQLGAKALITTLEQLRAHKITPTPQDNQLATYASKITKEEAAINWHDSAVRILRHIKAFNPWPIAYTTFHEQHLKIWEATIGSQMISQKPAGTIIGTNQIGIEVATAQGSIYLTKIQLAGGKPISARDFLNAKGSQIKINETTLGNRC